MDVSIDGRRTLFHFFISETSRDIKKMVLHHLNIFKSCVNFENLEGMAQKLGPSMVTLTILRPDLQSQNRVDVDYEKTTGSIYLKF